MPDFSIPVADREMKAVLDVVADGDQAGAYELAKTLTDDTQRRAAQWAAIYYGNGEVPSASVLNYIAEAPDFAKGAVFRTRL